MEEKKTKRGDVFKQKKCNCLLSLWVSPSEARPAGKHTLQQWNKAFYTPSPEAPPL